MTYYEKYKALHKDRIKQKILAKYRLLQQYDPGSYSSTASYTDSPSQDDTSGSPMQDYTTHCLTQEFTSHWIDTQTLSNDRRTKQPLNPMLERLKQSDLQFCMPAVSTKYPAIDRHDKMETMCNKGLGGTTDCRQSGQRYDKHTSTHNHDNCSSMTHQETSDGVYSITQCDSALRIEVIPLYINGKVPPDGTENMDHTCSREVSSSEHTSHYKSAMDVETSVDEESEQSLPFLSAESGETCSRHGILGISSAAISSIVRSVSHYEPLVSEYHTETV